MATSSPSPSAVEPNIDQSEQKNIQSQAPTDQTPASAENPNSIPPQIGQLVPPIPNPSQSYVPPFRPVAPQFSPIANLNPNQHNPTMQNPSFQNPNIQPPGVSPVSMMFPGVATGSGSAMVSVSNIRPPGIYQTPPGQPPMLVSTMPYPQLPGGYITPQGQGAVPPPAFHSSW